MDYLKFILPFPQQETILIDFLDNNKDTSVVNEFFIDLEKEKINICNYSTYVKYTTWLRKFDPESYKIIKDKDLEVYYGDEEYGITSKFPWFYSNEIKDVRIKLGKDPREDTYIVSPRGRSITRKDLIDAMIFPDSLKNPIEADDLSKYWRSIERLQCTEYYRAMFYSMQLGFFTGEEENASYSSNKLIRDLKDMRVKYRLNSLENWNLFGPAGINNLGPNPLRAIQWKDSEESFGIWLKPHQVFGSTIISPGYPILIIGERCADLRPIEYYSFGNNNGIVFYNKDPRYLLLKVEGYNGFYHTILYSDRGFKKSLIPSMGKADKRINNLTLIDILRDAYPDEVVLQSSYVNIHHELWKKLESSYGVGLTGNTSDVNYLKEIGNIIT